LITLTEQNKKEAARVVSNLIHEYQDVKDYFMDYNDEMESIEGLIFEYIENHKWLLQEKIPFTVTVNQAFHSWYENVFLYQTSAMRATGIRRAVIHQSNKELFDLVSKEYYSMTDKDDIFCYAIACQRVIKKYSTKWIYKFLAKIYMKKA